MKWSRKLPWPPVDQADRVAPRACTFSWGELSHKHNEVNQQVTI